MTAAHDHDDLHHLVNRLSPPQAERLRVLAAPRSGVCPRRAARSSGKAAGQRRLPVIGIWEPGRGDLPEQHDEIIRGRLKHPARHCPPALAARHGHRPLRQPPRPLRCPAAIRRRLSASPTTVIAEMCWLPEQRPGNEPAFLTPVTTGAATLDPRHFTVVRPPTHSRPEPPATDADRAARQALDRAACHAPPQNFSTLGSPNRHYLRLLLPGAGPRRHADHGDPHRRARGRCDRPHPNLPKVVRCPVG